MLRPWLRDARVHPATAHWRSKSDLASRLRPGRGGARPPAVSPPSHLFGLHPVLAALQLRSRRAAALHVSDAVWTDWKSLSSGVAVTESALSARKRRRLEDSPEVAAVRLALAQGLRVRAHSRQDLNVLAGDRPHQGLVLEAEDLVVPFAEDVLESSADAILTPSMRTLTPPPVVLVVDGVADPQNLGAILRSAYCLDCAAVLVTDRGTAPFSPVASKASAGAMEVLAARRRLFRTRRLGSFLEFCRSERGLLHGTRWQVLGAVPDEPRASEPGIAPGKNQGGDSGEGEGGREGGEGEGRGGGGGGGGGGGEGERERREGGDVGGSVAVPVVDSRRLRRDRPTVLVVGSEGAGLRRSIRGLCDAFVTIPRVSGGDHDDVWQTGRGERGPLVDSLNVSVATALLLHQLLPER